MTLKVYEQGYIAAYALRGLPALTCKIYAPAMYNVGLNYRIKEAFIVHLLFNNTKRNHGS